MGIVLTKGPMEVCKSWATAKAKQKNTTHDSSGQGKSTTYKDNLYGIDGFYKAKGSFIKPVCKQLQKEKNVGKEVKINCQDNAGENEGGYYKTTE